MEEGAAILAKQIVAALLPPAGLAWVALAAVLVAARGRAVRRVPLWVAAFALIAMLAMQTPWVGSVLIDSIEQRAGPAIDAQAARRLLDGRDAPQAIVVLGGGMRTDLREAPERDFPKARTLERLEAAARLARWTKLPMALSGGRPPGSRQAEATVMARVLESSYGIRARWSETGSRDTAENASMSAALLQHEGIRRILLVTHAYHMARARAEFERAGFVVTPAPTGFLAGRGRPAALAWLPRLDGALRSTLAVHEWTGLLWFELRPHHLGRLPSG